MIPRTLARTALIERGVVRVEGSGITVAQSSEAPAAGAKGKPLAGSISADAFFEAMAARDPRLPERIRAFLQVVQPLGVYPEFRKSLNLKWDAPSGRTANLPTAGRPDLPLGHRRRYRRCRCIRAAMTHRRTSTLRELFVQADGGGWEELFKNWRPDAHQARNSPAP